MGKNHASQYANFGSLHKFSIQILSYCCYERFWWKPLEALLLCWRIIFMISPNCCSIDIAMSLFFIRLILIYVCKQLLKFCYCWTNSYTFLFYFSHQLCQGVVIRSIFCLAFSSGVIIPIKLPFFYLILFLDAIILRKYKELYSKSQFVFSFLLRSQ